MALHDHVNASLGVQFASRSFPYRFSLRLKRRRKDAVRLITRGVAIEESRRDPKLVFFAWRRPVWTT